MEYRDLLESAVPRNSDTSLAAYHIRNFRHIFLPPPNQNLHNGIFYSNNVPAEDLPP